MHTLRHAVTRTHTITPSPEPVTLLKPIYPNSFDNHINSILICNKINTAQYRTLSSTLHHADNINSTLPIPTHSVLRWNASKHNHASAEYGNKTAVELHTLLSQQHQDYPQTHLHPNRTNSYVYTLYRNI